MNVSFCEEKYLIINLLSMAIHIYQFICKSNLRMFAMIIKEKHYYNSSELFALILHNIFIPKGYQWIRSN